MPCSLAEKPRTVPIFCDTPGVTVTTVPRRFGPRLSLLVRLFVVVGGVLEVVGLFFAEQPAALGRSVPPVVGLVLAVVLTGLVARALVMSFGVAKQIIYAAIWLMAGGLLGQALLLRGDPWWVGLLTVIAACVVSLASLVMIIRVENRSG